MNEIKEERFVLCPECGSQRVSCTGEVFYEQPLFLNLSKISERTFWVKNLTNHRNLGEDGSDELVRR